MKPILALYSYSEVNDNLFNLVVVEENLPKNGDQEFFGFIQIYQYRTWAFFSLNQIKELEKDYKIKKTNLMKPLEEVKDLGSQQGVHFSQKKAKTEKHYLNLSFIYLFKPCSLAYAKKGNLYDMNRTMKKLSFIKKNPLISLAMDDKQEIFYQKKNTYSFRQAANFRQPQFNCDFTKKISKIQSLGQLTKELTSENITELDLKLIKRSIVSNWIKARKPEIEINFYYLAMIESTSKIFGSNVLSDLIKDSSFDEVIKNRHFNDLESCILLNSSLYSNFLELMAIFKNIDINWTLQRFVKWDLPTHRISDFLTYHKKLVETGIKIQYTKYSSLKYLFNVISKEYTKLEVDNFLLPNKNKPNLSDVIPPNFGDFSLVIPKDYKILIQWGAFLHNCAGNFEQQDYYLETLTIGLFKNQNIEYLASIQEGNLSQLKGFKNSAPTKEMYEDFLHFLIQTKAIYSNSNVSYKKCCVQHQGDDY